MENFGVVMQIDEKKSLLKIESINDKSSKQISRNKSEDKNEFENEFYKHIWKIEEIKV